MYANDKFRKIGIKEEILDRVERGKDGALAILRDSHGSLTLRSARRSLPVVELRVQLEAEGGRFAWTTDDFEGMLLLDDHGDCGCEARLAVVDDNGRQVVTSDSVGLTGRAFLVAEGTGAKGEPRPVTCYALFQMRLGESPRSAQLVDASDEFLSFADLDWEMTMGGCGDGGM